jgi:hypothetical protein
MYPPSLTWDFEMLSGGQRTRYHASTIYEVPSTMKVRDHTPNGMSLPPSLEQIKTVNLITDRIIRSRKNSKQQICTIPHMYKLLTLVVLREKGDYQNIAINQ